MTELITLRTLLEDYFPNSIVLRKFIKQVIEVYNTWNELANKYSNKIVMTQDEYVMVKASQEIRNFLVRILIGWNGEIPSTSEEQIKELLTQVGVRP